MCAGAWLETALLLALLAAAGVACTQQSASSADAGPFASGGAAGTSPTAGGAGTSPSGGSSGASPASGGSSASGGTPGAAIDSGPRRGPTPPELGVQFPFPQNRESARCIYPSGYRNEDVEKAFATWKADQVTADGAGGHLRVKRPNDPTLEKDSTVSEGIGYGMLIAVYMNDQMLFDELWKYERLWLDDNGLMDWYITATGTARLGTGGATDAD